MYVRAFGCLCLVGRAEIDKRHNQLFFRLQKHQFIILVDRVKLSSSNNREDKYLFMKDDSMR